MNAKDPRRLVLRGRWPAGVLSAALAVSGGAATGLTGGSPAQAANSTIAAASTTTKKGWLVDPALTTLHEAETVIGAPAVWSKKDAAGRKLTGQGIGVALIDSGIAPVKGLGIAGGAKRPGAKKTAAKPEVATPSAPAAEPESKSEPATEAKAPAAPVKGLGIARGARPPGKR